MRFYDVWDGTIKIDDVETRDATRKSLRKAYAMVLQDTWLFTGTILIILLTERECHHGRGC